ncbi:bifunctional DNA-formamidopyrimidine glycosylase/DNA-(apurinic or apyrimidinic site) lyase [soil metagenome]
MPELPEVETVRASLTPHVMRRTVLRAVAHRRDIVDGPAGARNLLEGGVIAEVSRTGKQLGISVKDGRTIGVHLGMSGQLRFIPAGQRPRKTTHVHAQWALSAAAGKRKARADPRGDDAPAAVSAADLKPDAPSWFDRIIFRDPRRFGGITTHATRADFAARRVEPLGPDALAVTSTHLAHAIAGSRRPIKSALLDQGVLAGVGNIYADEALFASRIHPARLAAGLSREEITALTLAVKTVLAQAVRAKGSTLRDYVSATGRAGKATLNHQVYGRSGEMCLRCGGALETVTIAQRTTVLCPRCQPRGVVTKVTGKKGVKEIGKKTKKKQR